MAQSTDRTIYLDNAATSFPKPDEVAEAMDHLIRTASLSPGRAAHQMSLAASRVIFETREAVAELFHYPDSSRVVFTANVTESLNIGILGLLRAGDHVITTGLEHNSVMRPLRHLEQSIGIHIETLPTSASGQVITTELPHLIRPETRLIVATHVSNVTGAVTDLGAIGRHKGNAVFMVDAAQSAGIFPIDMEKEFIDFLAFTGHKGLLGPTGTGGFIVRQGIFLSPLKMGGTGSNSEHEEQPTIMPDRFESGTLNTLGICGLGAGLAFIKRVGLDTIRTHEQRLTTMLLEGLATIPSITVYGPPAGNNRASVVSFRMAGKSVSDLSQILDRDYRIMTRCGLHCAPAAHKSMHTFPDGTVRLSSGFFNTDKDIKDCLAALLNISRS